MGLLTALVCLWAAIPGPPGLMLDGGYFQAAPVQRDTPPCDVIHPTNDVTFHLYQGSDALSFHELLPGDDSLLKMSGFNPRLPTVLYVHGFLNGPDAEEVSVMKQAYAERGGHNFIVVGWRRLAAGPWYLTAVANTVPVGRYCARLLDFLEEKAGPLTSVHVIGHSLGAHVAGVAASNVSLARVARVTGLDPALTLIDSRPTEERLDASDAPFVDIIHTDGGKFGFFSSLGHADFFPNGGVANQPGCGFGSDTSTSVLGRVFCSHRRSYWLYAATVVRELAFPSTLCATWKSYQAGECAAAQQVPMGFSVLTSARGSFYLTVKEVPPY